MRWIIVKRITAILLSSIFLISCANVPDKKEEPLVVHDGDAEFPDKVFFRTPFESINEKYYFLLSNNSLYVKKRDDLNADIPGWYRIDNYRMSISTKESDKIISDKIDQINIDGKKMELIYADKIYSCNSGLSEYSDWIWDGSWGFPFALGPGIELPQKYRGWSVSYADPDIHKYQTDQNGNKFSVFVGSIFILSEDGTLIYIADPWTPADWGYRIATPLRGRFIASSISASGSVVFIMNDYGDMFTKYVDFDVIGANPTLSYTYETIPIYEGIFDREHPRKLPIPDWKRQPKIAGAISDRITVYTTGEGEAARNLRVEGLDPNGNTGYFEKGLSDEKWTFVRTPLSIDTDRLLHNTSEGTVPSVQGEEKDLRYAGKIGGYEVILEDFNLYCSPSSLRVLLKSGISLQLYLHTVFTFRTQIQRNPGTHGSPLDLKGVIEIPENLVMSTNSETKDFLRRYFNYPQNSQISRFIPISAKATKTGIHLRRVGLLGIFSRLRIDFSLQQP